MPGLICLLAIRDSCDHFGWEFRHFQYLDLAYEVWDQQVADTRNYQMVVTAYRKGLNLPSPHYKMTLALTWDDVGPRGPVVSPN